MIIDLWGAKHTDNLAVVEKALLDAVKACGATLLHTHLHHFTPNGGITGVVVLAESHISIHSWPEREYCALDIFMCGTCLPTKSLPIFRAAFQPKTIQVSEQMRGAVYE